MANAKKLLERMKANPKGDWRINNLQTIANAHNITWRQRGSHVMFIGVNDTISVPAKRPIKPIYVKMFVDFIER